MKAGINVHGLSHNLLKSFDVIFGGQKVVHQILADFSALILESRLKEGMAQRKEKREVVGVLKD